MQPEIAAKVISHIIKASKNTMLNDIQESSSHKEDSEAVKAIIFKAKSTKSELTEREKEILQLVGKGMSNTEIAKKLYISVGTVKNYISNLYSKLQVEDRSKLVLYAINIDSEN